VTVFQYIDIGIRYFPRLHYFKPVRKYGHWAGTP